MNLYSTCTFAPEENEGLILRFLNHHPNFVLEKIDVPWGCPGFSAERIKPFTDEVNEQIDLSHCRRIFPHHGGEGHFIALLKRTDESHPVSILSYNYAKSDRNRDKARTLYQDCFTDIPNGILETIGEHIRLLPSNLPDCTGLGVLSAGVAVATVCKNRLEPAHSIFMAARQMDCKQCLDLSYSDVRLTAFLHGEEIFCDSLRGWTVVCVEGIPVGFGKASNGRLKNRYPKGLRLI